MLNSLRFRLAASLALVVLVTLAAAGLALFARLGGYRDDLTVSTLRQVAAPVYYNLTLFQPNENERPLVAGRRLRGEIDEYLRLQAETTGVIVLPIDADGRVISSDAIDPQLASRTFEVPPPPQRGPNFDDLQQGEFTADGGNVLYVTVPTTRLVRAQQSGIYAIVVALPSDRRDVWRDLSPRLIFAGGVGLTVALLTVLLLWASLFRTLGKVTGGIRAVAAGDYTQRVRESGPTEVRALARDVNAMADSVEASQRTLREFLANVSHELRTPLTSIRGFSQAMLDGTLESPEERARAARVIDSESRRLLHLVGELLDLSRIESGQQRMDAAPIELAELLAHVGDVFSLRSEETGITLEIGPPASIVVLADFDRIEQVLGNLIDNAFRHTRRGGRIGVSARATGGAAEISVDDDGEGIAADDLPHVFDRFYQSSLAGAGAASGSGLGLAIAREIVRAHGGAIRVEARDGGGTRFAFTLPLARTPAPRSAGDAPRAPQRPGDTAPADT